MNTTTDTKIIRAFEAWQRGFDEEYLEKLSEEASIEAAETGADRELCFCPELYHEEWLERFFKRHNLPPIDEFQAEANRCVAADLIDDVF